MPAPAAVIQGALVDAKNVEWRSIKTARGKYEVSALGEVRSLDHYVRVVRYGALYYRLQWGRILKPGLDSSGYRQVNVGGQMRRVCVLIAQAFIGPRPAGMQVCHNDGCRTNDSKENLRYDTPTGNQSDSLKHGTRVLGEQKPLAKLTAKNVLAIRHRCSHGALQKDLATEFGVARNTIKQVIHRRTWKHV